MRLEIHVRVEPDDYGPLCLAEARLLVDAELATLRGFSLFALSRDLVEGVLSEGVRKLDANTPRGPNGHGPSADR